MVGLSAVVFSIVFIPNEIKVAPGRVTLFDLAASYTEDPALLKSIVVTYITQGSQTLLSNYIKYLAKRKGISITFESSKVVVIVKEPEKKEKDRHIPRDILAIASETAAFIATSTGLCTSPSTWALLWYSGKVGEGKKKVKYSKLGGSLFSIFITFKGTKTSYLSMKLKVSCYKEVLVINRNLRYGEKIYPEYVERKVIDIFEIRGTPASTEDAFYAKAAKFLRKGSVITLESIKRKPDVVKGQTLMAYVKIGGIYITTLVVALEDGWIGEPLRVKNLSSGKIIEGVLEEGPVVRVLEVKR